MGREKKDINIQVGARLKRIRENAGYSQAQFAEMLGIGDEHYRKLENGSTGLTVEKIWTLGRRCHVDPTFLILGEQNKEFDFDTYITNCTREQRNELMGRILEYMKKYFEIDL